MDWGIKNNFDILTKVEHTTQNNKSVEVVPIITHYFLTQIITKWKLELLNIF